MKIIYRATVPLNPVTKKNSQRIVKCGNYSRLLPSKAYVRYEKECGYFLKRLERPINALCEVTYLFYMKTLRKVDLTNLEEAIDDVLVKYGVLEDDNSRIIVSHDGSRVYHDPENPRTEIVIKSMSKEEENGNFGAKRDYD